MTGLMMCSMTSCADLLLGDLAACCVEMTTVSTRDGLAVLVLDGDLALAVGAQIGHRTVVSPGGAAHLGELAGELWA